MVAFIPPQVPTPAAEPPSGREWIHEIKHDGFRTMLAIDNGKARAFTRNGYDWTARYAAVIEACASLACRSALLDGEIVVEDTNGVSLMSMTLHRDVAKSPSKCRSIRRCQPLSP